MVLRNRDDRLLRVGFGLFIDRFFWAGKLTFVRFASGLLRFTTFEGLLFLYLFALLPVVVEILNLLFILTSNRVG
jgi:hypothetical protein